MMRQTFFVLLAASALAASPSAYAQDAASPAIVAYDAATDGDTGRLVNVVIDPELFTSLIVGGIGEGIKQGVQASQGGDQLFVEHPELLKRLIAKTSDALVPLVISNLPTLQAQVSALLRSHMTGPQLKAAADFMETPSGRKLFSMGAEAGMREKMGGSGEVSNAQLMGAIDKADTKLLLRFNNSGAADAFESIGPELEKIVGAWSANLVAGREEQFQMIGMETTIDYFKEQGQNPPAQ